MNPPKWLHYHRGFHFLDPLGGLGREFEQGEERSVRFNTCLECQAAHPLGTKVNISKVVHWDAPGLYQLQSIFPI